MNLLLDTTVLIDVLRMRRGRRDFLADLIGAGHTLSTAAINLGEVYAGVRSGEESKTDDFLAGLDCYPVTRLIARRAGLLRSSYAAREITLTLADMIVAATALEHGATLLTDNRRDFPIPELSFFPLP